jgi:exonuclease VII large subunit
MRPMQVAHSGQQQPKNRAVAAAAPEDRLASLKERSRLAQQRYRAKQRQKLRSTTAQVEELTRELEVLRTQQVLHQGLSLHAGARCMLCKDPIAAVPSATLLAQSSARCSVCNPRVVCRQSRDAGRCCSSALWPPRTATAGGQRCA